LVYGDCFCGAFFGAVGFGVFGGGWVGVGILVSFFGFLVRMDEREVRRFLLMRALQVWINFRWNLSRSTCVVPTGDIWSGSVESQSEEDA
jgi:hypothetical protein